MPEIAGAEEWQLARLITVAGIRGQDEQEARATSALLAVLGLFRRSQTRSSACSELLAAGVENVL